MIEKLHQLFLNSTGVSTDTRNIKKGNIFFALKGENFNGNQYASKALEQGAQYAVVDEPNVVLDKRYILVDDVLNGLQGLATFHREYLGIPIISLTGSNGKTTTKELINTVLSKQFKTVATKGNLNNHIGVPLTLLTMTTKTEFGIVEMGANHLKEIEMLCKIAKPNYGYITNFGKAHLEGFGSEEGIIKGKSELYDFLKQNDGLLFVNVDDPKQVKQSENGKVFTFGSTSQADLCIQFVEANPLVKLKFNSTEINSQLIGAYNSNNIAAAIAIGQYFDITDDNIKEAINSYIPQNNRSQIINKKDNTIILDAYNANPSSMKVAIENLDQLEAKHKVAILGDMFELGLAAVLEHQYIAELALSSSIDTLILVGENFSKTLLTKGHFTKFKSTEELLESTIINSFSNSTILIKGSRGMALERVLHSL